MKNNCPICNKSIIGDPWTNYQCPTQHLFDDFELRYHYEVSSNSLFIMVEHFELEYKNDKCFLSWNNVSQIEIDKDFDYLDPNAFDKLNGYYFFI